MTQRIAPLDRAPGMEGARAPTSGDRSDVTCASSSPTIPRAASG